MADRARSGTRWLVLAIVTLAIGLVVGGSLWVIDLSRDRPARAALDRGSVMVTPAHAALAVAGSTEELLRAARGYAGLAAELDQERSKVASGRGRLALAAAAMLAAQRDLAAASDAIAAVEPGDLVGWAEVRHGLVEALDGHDRALTGLATVDRRRAAAAALPERFAEHVRELVEQAAVGAAGDGLAALLDRLSAATSTAEVRAVARDTRRTRPTVRAVRDGFIPGTRAYRRLSTYAGLQFALVKLRQLDTDHLSDWGRLGGRLVRATRALRPTDRELRARSSRAIADIGALVHRGRKALRAWERDRDRARRGKESTLRLLSTYRGGMGRQLVEYSRLRTDLDGFLGRVADRRTFVGYREARRVLSAAEQDRYGLRVAMDALRVPPRVIDEHRALTRAVDRAAAAVYDGYADLPPGRRCGRRCDYRRHPDYRRLTGELVAVNAAYRQAVATWRLTVVHARREARHRRLPERPVV